MVENDGARRDPLPRVPDDWFEGFHEGLVARFWRAAGATMADENAATGVDIAAAEVERAGRAAAEAGVPARFAVGDLRALPDVGPVHAVLSSSR